MNVLKLDHKVESGINVFRSWTESTMAYTGQPGLSVAVDRDQDVIWSKGFGYADKEQGIKAAPDTIYRIASITKLFTSTAVMQLRDKGKLNLYDPITEYLPWFDIGERKGRPITVENLITHTSGLPREAMGPYWTTYEFPEKNKVIENLPNQKHPLHTWRKWKYSNLALSLAGYIVEETSGVPYETYIKENILDPLAMNSTYVSVPADYPKLAKGYGRRLPDGSRTKSPYTDSKGITPAANMATTVMDLAKFASLQFKENEDNPVLDSETIREMHRVHWLDPNWELGWGLGFNILRLNGKTYIGHGGSVKGYRTSLRINLDDRIAVIVFTNADDGNPVNYIEKAYQYIATNLVKVKPLKTPDENWTRYLGKYRNTWGDVEVLTVDGELLLISPQLPDPMYEPTKLVPVSEHTFMMEAPGYGSHGESAVFEMEEGRVMRLKTGENYTYPVDMW